MTPHDIEQLVSDLQASFTIPAEIARAASVAACTLLAIHFIRDELSDEGKETAEWAAKMVLVMMSFVADASNYHDKDKVYQAFQKASETVMRHYKAAVMH